MLLKVKTREWFSALFRLSSVLSVVLVVVHHTMLSFKHLALKSVVSIPTSIDRYWRLLEHQCQHGKLMMGTSITNSCVLVWELKAKLNTADSLYTHKKWFEKPLWKKSVCLKAVAFHPESAVPHQQRWTWVIQSTSSGCSKSEPDFHPHEIILSLSGLLLLYFAVVVCDGSSHCLVWLWTYSAQAALKLLCSSCFYLTSARITCTTTHSYGNTII